MGGVSNICTGHLAQPNQLVPLLGNLKKGVPACLVTDEHGRPK
jgi:hypothetical protein